MKKIINGLKELSLPSLSSLNNLIISNRNDNVKNSQIPKEILDVFKQYFPNLMEN